MFKSTHPDRTSRFPAAPKFYYTKTARRPPQFPHAPPMRAAAASLTAAASAAATAGGDPAALHAVLVKTASSNRAAYNLLLSRYPPSRSETLLSRLPFHPNAASLTSYPTSVSSSSPSSALPLLRRVLGM
jgi:hypothetical protein